MKLPAQLCICVITLWLFPLPLTEATKVKGKCELVVNCSKKAENASESCYEFMNHLDKNCGGGASYCDKYKADLIKACTEGFCKECLENANRANKDCIKFYNKIASSDQDLKHCKSVKKVLFQKCPDVCKGAKGQTKDNPGISCRDILDSRAYDLKSGLYWIRPDGDASAVQSYCDMKYQGGGWTLASYGYVAGNGYNDGNKNIPNMNHPNGYTWHPNQRSNDKGVVALQHGAVNLARGAKFMIMAAGNNPASGGINEYSYVFFIDISHNPYNITFANHNRRHGAVGTSTIPKMHVVEFTVKALKGETGSAKRYALAEALGVTWSDTYPTGYGFSPVNAHFATWNKGPFFPSVHSGDRPAAGGCQAAKPYAPDVEKGCPNYAHLGWHSLHATQKSGQTSIWFK
ncbi:uncharacterized protein LOC114523360 [Dendronephthya gigantea]|uniref:uncharacterized protein LOC114523360 n=1 Tax=Dendronephthya gigantea TaxID=151771 RepID=UPI00106D72A0|nr:uncharacterized protein LOC114523360 [Dendronephthya gigantea]XP_028400058.1 uncharacterized protein LOC114523360 [Dendronephthya gigantea]